MAKIATEKITLAVTDGTSMNAYVARPEEQGKFPGMLVLQEAFGVNPHIRDITERIAREGYVAIAPELFHRTGPGFEGTYDNFPAVMPHMQGLTEDGQAADMRAAYDWLRAEPAESRRTASPASASAWAAARRFSRMRLCRCKPRSRFMAAASRRHFCRARPICTHRFCFSGAVSISTSLWNTGGRWRMRLTAAEKAFVNVTVSYADHGFFCDARASYNPVAAGLAWKLTLGFLDTYVKGTAATAHA